MDLVDRSEVGLVRRERLGERAIALWNSRNVLRASLSHGPLARRADHLGADREQVLGEERLLTGEPLVEAQEERRRAHDFGPEDRPALLAGQLRLDDVLGAARPVPARCRSAPARACRRSAAPASRCALSGSVKRQPVPVRELLDVDRAVSASSASRYSRSGLVPCAGKLPQRGRTRSRAGGRGQDRRDDADQELVERHLGAVGGLEVLEEATLQLALDDARGKSRGLRRRPASVDGRTARRPSAGSRGTTGRRAAPTETASRSGRSVRAECDRGRRSRRAAERRG